MRKAKNPATCRLVREDLDPKKPVTACGLYLADCSGRYLTPWDEEVNCVGCLTQMKMRGGFKV